jgi:hypothetical protein
MSRHPSQPRPIRIGRAGADDTSVTFAAAAACYVLHDLRAAGQHELADRAEADLAEAVRVIARAAGPRLRESIRAALLAEVPV